LVSGGDRSRLSYTLRVGRAVLRNPPEAKERILDRIDEWREQHSAARRVAVDQEWDRRLHEMLHATWPCAESDAFRHMWSEISQLLAAKDLAVGRGAFGGWDDADPALARAAWCITSHARPHTVVETGVGRGVTTRVILEALKRNADGHLFSIDQPPLVDLELRSEIAAAVREDLRSRWTLVEGSSRRRLGGVLEVIGGLDFFLHDSMHSRRNMTFEVQTVWPMLKPGGIVLMDDIDRSDSFRSFTDEIGTDHDSLIVSADDGRALIGVIQKAPS
jgi:predicted O-methyltransferase YrrM